MRFSDLLKAPNISRPALEVRAGIDDLQRFFLHPLEQPSAFPLRDSEAHPKGGASSRLGA